MTSCFVEKRTSLVDFTMPLHHTHAYYELYVLADGKREFYIENDEYTLVKNDLLLVPAKVLHRTSGGSFTRYLVNFSDEYIDAELLNIIELCQNYKISMSNDETKNIINIIELMYDLQEDNSKSAQKNKDFYFKTLFRYLIFSLSRLHNFPKVKFVSKNKYSEKTKKVISHINANFKESITLDSLCKILYVSKSVLCNDFKKNTGMSIIDYLLKTRLKEAERLLMYTEKPISEVADLCGFSSQQYFYLMFRKHIGTSPSTYRKNNGIFISY